MKIYQIKITLKHIQPPIWRRIEVPSDIKIGKLHRVLQEVMGWTDMHLHAFRVGQDSYGVPDPESTDDTLNERNVCLDVIAKEGDSLVYEYDFGDGWEHELKIERTLSAEAGISYPLCTAGKRACPPEDCGGPHSYEHLLEVLRDAKHEEHEEMREWVPPGFDPETFDLDDINKVLKRIR